MGRAGIHGEPNCPPAVDSFGCLAWKHRAVALWIHPALVLLVHLAFVLSDPAIPVTDEKPGGTTQSGPRRNRRTTTWPAPADLAPTTPPPWPDRLRTVARGASWPRELGAAKGCSRSRATRRSGWGAGTSTRAGEAGASASDRDAAARAARTVAAVLDGGGSGRAPADAGTGDPTTRSGCRRGKEPADSRMRAPAGSVRDCAPDSTIPTSSCAAEGDRIRNGRTQPCGEEEEVADGTLPSSRTVRGRRSTRDGRDRTSCARTPPEEGAGVAAQG